MSDEENENGCVDLVKTAEKNIVTVYVNDLTEESYKSFRSSMLKAEKSGQTIIPIVIDSDGGVAESLFAMLDLITSIKLSIATIGTSKIKSAAVALLAAGTKGMRYVSPLSRIMVHEAACMVYGKNSEVKTTAHELDHINDIYFNLLDKYCGKQIGYWKSHLKEAKNADLYLTAEQAKEHGLIDVIGMPRITAEVKAKTKLVV